MKQNKTKNEFFEKVKSISQNATKVVVDMASDIVESTRDMATSTVDKVNASIGETRESGVQYARRKESGCRKGSEG